MSHGMPCTAMDEESNEVEEGVTNPTNMHVVRLLIVQFLGESYCIKLVVRWDTQLADCCMSGFCGRHWNVCDDL